MITYLQVEKLCKRFGDVVLLDAVSFGITEKQHVGLVAPNGMGKSTLLKIITGKEDFESGTVELRRDLRVASLDQYPQFPENLTVLQACFHSDNKIVSLILEYEQAIASNNPARLEQLLTEMDHFGAWDYEQRAKVILSKLKIFDFDQKIDTLSGGQLKRVALANVLISEPDFLILDEPTNHLDLEMIEWLEEYLRAGHFSLLMVTHDRYFLDRVCSEIIEIDNHQLYQYKGNYDYFLEKRQERLDAQNSELDHAHNLFRKELEWMRRQPQARATKAKSRIDAFHELEDKINQQVVHDTLRMDVKASYIGNKIFEARHISKSYDDNRLLADFNYTFSRYEKLGIVGNNGTGKSTFIKMLLGEVQPDSGAFDIGETVRFGYYSQEGLQFNDQMKVIDIIRDIAEEIDLGNGKKRSASQFLQYFLFSPEKQHNYVHKLSGGEKRRLYLCTVLIKNPNFLILDEPTNDLDIITLNVLEDYLATFKGCLIIVSHDRFFIDKIVDHILVFNGNGDIKDFPGNYSQYRTWKETQSPEKPAAKVREERKHNTPSVRNEQKMSFREKREFELLDEEIPILESEKANLENELSFGNLSPEELFSKSTKISELIKLLEEKTNRWLELSEKT